MDGSRLLLRAAWPTVLPLFLLLGACGGTKSTGGGDNPLATPAGTPVGTLATATIGAAGGSLSSSDGLLTLDVPAGALASDTTIGIQGLTDPLPSGVGPGYLLTPGGQSFAQPVTLTFKYSDAELGGMDPVAMGVARQDASGYWHAQTAITRDATAKTITLTIDHFGAAAPSQAGSALTVAAGAAPTPPEPYTRYWQWLLVPLSADIKVSESQGLQLEECTKTGTDGQPLTVDQFINACHSTSSAKVTSWDINGGTGIPSQSGTVTAGSATSAVYNAPATIPTHKLLVHVGAHVKLVVQGKEDPHYIVSDITVEDGCFIHWPFLVATGAPVAAPSSTCSLTYAGNSTTTLGYTITADVTWTLKSQVGNLFTFQPSGTATFSFPGCTIAPSSQAIQPDEGTLVIDTTNSPATYTAQGGTVWPATYSCGGTPTTLSAGGIWLGGSGTGQVATGTVASDGSIAGSGGSGGQSWSWSFTLQ
jgi:hypothetical protein